MALFLEKEIRLLIVLAVILLFSPNLIYPLNPQKPIELYIHDVWRSEDGLPQSSVTTITQTRDGYLWLGTESEVVRFDGVNLRLFNHGNSIAFQDGRVMGLTADAEGNLWVRFQNLSLLRYRSGTFQNVLPDPLPPTIANVWPWPISRSTALTAGWAWSG